MESVSEATAKEIFSDNQLWPRIFRTDSRHTMMSLLRSHLVSHFIRVYIPQVYSTREFLKLAPTSRCLHISTDYPLTAWDQGNDLCGDSTANVTQDSDAGNRQIYRN